MLKYTQLTIYTLILVLLSTTTVMAMSSSNYQIDWDSVNSGGGDSNSASYSLEDTVGQLSVGRSSSANYLLEAGYQLSDVEEPLLVFNMGTQLSSSRATYSIFNNASKTVTIASATSFFVNDRIAVIENSGEQQYIAIGKIVAINGVEVAVDNWDGDGALMSLNASGDDDYVYRLTNRVMDFGMLNYRDVSIMSGYVEVSTNISNGYTVYIKENHNPRSGNNQISDVSDGGVTAGQGEYGVEAVGQDAFRGEDWAITEEKKILSQNGTQVENRRTGVQYKITGGVNVPEGDYSHTISFYCTPNY